MNDTNQGNKVSEVMALSKAEKDNFYDSMVSAKDAVMSLPPIEDPNKFWKEMLTDYSEDRERQQERETESKLKELLADIHGVSLNEHRPVLLITAGDVSNSRCEIALNVENSSFDGNIKIEGHGSFFSNQKTIYVRGPFISTSYSNFGRDCYFDGQDEHVIMAHPLAARIGKMPVNGIFTIVDEKDENSDIQERADTSYAEGERVLRVRNFFRFDRKDGRVVAMPTNRILGAYFSKLLNYSVNKPSSPADFMDVEEGISTLFDSATSLRPGLETVLPQEYEHFKEQLIRLYKVITYAEDKPFFFDKQSIELDTDICAAEKIKGFEINRTIRISADPKIMSLRLSASRKDINYDNFDGMLRNILDTEFF